MALALCCPVHFTQSTIEGAHDMTHDMTHDMDWEVAVYYISDDDSGVLYFNLSTADEAEYLARCYISKHSLNATVKVDRKSSTVLILVP